MGRHWKAILWISVTLLCLAANGQKDDDGEFVGSWEEDEYDDWTDRFEDIFKNADDYQETLDKLNEARDADFANISEQVDKEKDSSDVERNEDQNIDIEETNISNPENTDTELQEDEERFFESPEDDEEFDESDEPNDEEVIGDEHLNGNAPPNDYDPLELAEAKNLDVDDVQDESEQSQDQDNNDENSNEIKSPYANPLDINPDMFEEEPNNYESNNDDEENEKVDVNIQNDKKSESAHSKSIEQQQLEDIFQETKGILNSDNSENNNFDDVVKENAQNDDVPQSIIEETQAILNDDPDNDDSPAEDDENDSPDMMYEDLNEDLKELLATLDKLQSDSKRNSSSETVENAEEAKVDLNKDAPEEWHDIVDDLNESDDVSVESDEKAANLQEMWEKTMPHPVEEIDPDNSDIDRADMDSTERDKAMLAELNAMIEKQLSEIDSGDDNVDDDYADLYDDDNNEAVDNIDKPPITYGNDAIDPNELNAKNNVDSIDASEVKENAIDLQGEGSSEIKEQGADIEEHSSDVDATNDKTNDEAPKVDAKAELTSEEIEERLEEFRFEHRTDIELEAALSDATPKPVKLSINEPVVITSPNYPEPYNQVEVIDWFFDGEGGSGIELNITDFSVNGQVEDYLLVKPGRADSSGDDGLIFSHMLRHERRYRFFDVDTMFVRFESKSTNWQNFKGFQLSAKFITEKVDRTPEPEPEPELLPAVPEGHNQTLTVFLTGVTHHEFKNISSDFRAIVVDMVAMYINRMSIDPGVLPLDEVVQLTRVAVCNINWPYHESCSAVTFGAPLMYNTTEEVEYQLTRSQLYDMWEMYSRIDPFAVRMRMLGIEEYDVPNDRAIVSVWWLATFGVFLFVLCLGFGLWRWNCFQDYTGMTRLIDDAESMGSARKSDLSLYPTPHQNLPPMFADGQYDSYLDGDYGSNVDTTRVDMGGAFDNKGIVRDGELMDLDSDEEIIMSLPDEGKTSSRPSYSSGIRPRDVFEV